MKVRIRFQKYGNMKFIGHLDFMRAWQKIFRRSQIPIAYSEGFNPHQVFSIGAPLGVGTIGMNEYLDLKLKVEEYDLDRLCQQINEVCPEGVQVTGARKLNDKETAAMAACYAALYRLVLSEDLHEVMDYCAFRSYLDQDSILIKKTNKKGKVNDFDLKPGIFSVVLDSEKKEIQLLLATGSSLNIKPDHIMSAFFEHQDITLLPSMFYITHREEIYQSLEPKLTLMELL